jgi:YD repeat-containing protein
MNEHAMKCPTGDTPRSNPSSVKSAPVCESLLRPLTSLILLLVVGGHVHAADSCYQFSVTSVAFTTPWLSDPQSACSSYASYCAGTPDGGKQSYCPVTSGPPWIVNYANGALQSANAFYPWGYWCSITANATYTYGNGSTYTANFGPLNASVSTRANPATSCGVFATVGPPIAAQAGPCCNRVPDPINPASGAVYDRLVDFSGAEDSIHFERFYNSTDSRGSDVSGGWRHSYSRSISPKFLNLSYQTYVVSADNSSLYSDETTACESGFRDIQSRVSTWANARASYSASDGVCTLLVGSTPIGTLTLVYTAPSPPAPGMKVIGFDALRDDGQLISFTSKGSSIVAPPSIGMTLQQTASGYTLTDQNDHIEQYDSNGRLLSITTRAGVVQTIGYDTSNRLSTVTDSFGHGLSLTYDSQNRLSSVTRQ